MTGKFPNELAETLYSLTMDGACEDSGNVDAPCGWFALVEDHEDEDYIVREDGQGFVEVEGPFESVAIGTVPAYVMRGGATSTSGYVQPARVRFGELCDEYSEWMDEDDEGEADEDQYSGNACVDCVQYIANGEPPLTDPDTGEDMDESATTAWVSAWATRNAGIHWVLGDSEGDNFSWSLCDTCGSRLGGNRHPVVGFSVKGDE